MMDEETMQATASLDQTAYDEDEHNGRSSADITGERKERRGASYVWSYCEKLSRHTIRCKLCTKVMSFHGTANVITHLQRRHNVLGEPGSQLHNKIDSMQTTSNIDNGVNYGNAMNSVKRVQRKSMNSASVVWKYCTRISSDQVRCCFCKKNLSYQGTSNLQRHLHRMHGVVTHSRNNKSAEEYDSVREESFKLPANTDFIWQFCTQIEDNPPRTKCNMCDGIFEAKDTEAIVKHLALIHSLETNPDGDGESKNVMRSRKRPRHMDFENSDDGNLDDYYNDAKWTKMDDNETQQLSSEFDEANIKKDESLYDELIEEDHNNYDEEPFDPSLVQDMPQTNPLSPQSSSNNSPNEQQALTYTQSNCPVAIPNVLPQLDIKVLQKLQEDRLRMETEYFREKAGFYRMQKYLTALQAKKTRFELERLSHGEEATVVTAADLNGAYAVEVALPEHHITTQ
ncbi:uncharacterized protein LOC106094416 [Stomoxys calcitrans]|uniref:BED-type domain-containing protein n=1 Tax=Stomoxys calcitrans TaxID=35570 RepID=A0A1I8PEK1_STOCA|nr:uncharacterized protein LOC106094416 [Stomoxys calcitrans]XP_059219758.1 uncharacterized protein LOC106094416 [Stomoxys calcitrans]